ncbi:hypothetical protein OPV22_019096 [Ensete ventricosum]|uniref:Uncharacterized protein n=1 Tax=Ensete ventricosum TaxID=4639 RepID=A0AAV8PGH3_ENSVE|nr:hypothetical protein OPV22_019096 [Ensete ventricosum]
MYLILDVQKRLRRCDTHDESSPSDQGSSDWAWDASEPSPAPRKNGSRRKHKKKATKQAESTMCGLLILELFMEKLQPAEEIDTCTIRKPSFKDLYGPSVIETRSNQEKIGVVSFLFCPLLQITVVQLVITRRKEHH